MQNSLLIVVMMFMFVYGFVPVWAYQRGVKDGMGVKNGVPPSVIQGPVKSIVRVVQEQKEKKEAAGVEEGYKNIMAYDGSEQKKASD